MLVSLGKKSGDCCWKTEGVRPHRTSRGRGSLRGVLWELWGLFGMLFSPFIWLRPEYVLVVWEEWSVWFLAHSFYEGNNKVPGWGRWPLLAFPDSSPSPQNPALARLPFECLWLLCSPSPVLPPPSDSPGSARGRHTFFCPLNSKHFTPCNKMQIMHSFIGGLLLWQVFVRCPVWVRHCSRHWEGRVNEAQRLCDSHSSWVLSFSKLGMQPYRCFFNSCINVFHTSDGLWRVMA